MPDNRNLCSCTCLISIGALASYRSKSRNESNRFPFERIVRLFFTVPCIYSFHILNTFFRQTDIPILRESAHMSVLSTDSPTYLEECDEPLSYYESTMMRVSKEGYYELVINGTMVLHVKFYKNHFNPMDPNVNLLQQYQGNCIVSQIMFTVNLWPDEIYYLMVATTFPSAISSYSVVSVGPSDIDFNKTSKYYCLC